MILRNIYHFLHSVLENAITLVHIIHRKKEYYEKIKCIRGRRKDEPIRLLFLATYSDTWKYDSLCKHVEDNPHFHVTILVCPVVNKGRQHMLETMEKCYQDLSNKGFSPIMAYESNSDNYITISSLNPDVVFFTNPYEGLIDSRYYLTNVHNILPCYVNYAYNIMNEKYFCGTEFHNVIWRYFCESLQIKSVVKKLSLNRACNSFVSGYPMYDIFVNGKPTTWPWKIKDKQIKRVIIAPHHSFLREDTIHFSNFLLYANTLLEVTEKYKDCIQFAFKPHPLLKQKLYSLPEWGQEKTDRYFHEWESRENTTCVYGDYVDLFLTSDALIHECGSFTIEYLYTLKPVLHMSPHTFLDQINCVAKKAYDCHYVGSNISDIDFFLKEVVIGSKDEKYHDRLSFFEQHLSPPTGTSVAESMVEIIMNGIYNNG